MIRLPRLRSLQARLLGLLLVMVALVWLGAAVLTWRDASDELGELLDGHLAQSAALLIVQQANRDIGASDDHGGDDKPEREDTPSLHKYAPKVAFQVFHEGQLTMRSSNTTSAPMSEKIRGFSTVRLPDNTQWRVYGAAGNESDVQVFVGELVQSRESILWAVLLAMLTPLVYALPLLAVVGWLAVRNGLAPLRQLSLALARRQPQALEPIVLRDVPAEIDPVVNSLNALFERIQAMMVSERRFTSDAAHELRTPIAAIRTQAQVALGAGDDAAQRQHALLFTLAGCDRATHLVEQLLTLSRLESSSSAPPSGLVDLAGVTRRVAGELAMTALGRGQELGLDAPEHAYIQADDTLSGVLVRNLLDNALRYSPDGARVGIAVKYESNQVILQVEDSGVGLSEADMARLGERFYRVLGTGQTGSGLGWSIVRRIAHVYQAAVHVTRSEKLGGLCVTIRWDQAHAIANAATTT
jgi:two-component system sensor histidine kinase QseC